MGIYIKGMKMPKRGMVVNIYADGRVTDHFDEFGRTIGTAVTVPPHGRLIDADALYRDFAEWEARALHKVGVARDDEDKAEWRKWSVILAERCAFKFDVADAPTIIEAEGVSE